MHVIAEHLESLGLRVTEGSTSEAERQYLVSVAQEIGARVVGEVGFNAGYAAYDLLAGSPDLKVVSFEIGKHPYTKPAQDFLNKRFPGRHQMVWGDSRQTVPGHTGGELFDMVFIDGGHRYDMAMADIVNLRKLCRPGAVVIMDDMVLGRYYGLGPTLAWIQAQRRGIVRQEGIYTDAGKVAHPQIFKRRAWARGQYTPDGT